MRFLVDVDEVLANFQKPAFEVVGRLTGRAYTPTDFLVWDIFSVLSDEELDAVLEEINKPGFCAALEPTPGSQEAIKAIKEFAEVFVVTSPMHSRHWVYERTEWLRDHFDVDSKHVVHTSSKHLVRGDAFLDDKPEHVSAWTKEHPEALAMLWHIPNTRTLGMDDLRVKNWDEVIQRLRDVL